MSKITSDHFPIFLEADDTQWSPCPFRFDDKWLKVNEFREKIKGWREIVCPVGQVSFRVAQMLKFLKSEIKKWSKEEGIRHDIKFKTLFDELEDIDRREGEGFLNVEEVEHRETVRTEVAASMQMEKIS